MINGKLKNNKLDCYDDLRQALFDLTLPYLEYLSPGMSGLELGPVAATFSEKAVKLEGFARLLWGYVPFLASGETGVKAGEVRKIVTNGIINGVNPGHEEFWGIPGDYDQLLVEMAVFGYALLAIPHIVWDPLSNEDKENFANWLSYINKRAIPECNWVFFRILVNCALLKLESPYADKKLLEDGLKQVDFFYLGDDSGGWYNDGFPAKRRARDYYIPWAMHYYGLLFARYCSDIYPDESAKFKKRAMAYCREYSAWFSEDGEALPFGRSLTYRFAQAAFWGALPLAMDEGPDWGEIKGLFLRNLRWWFRQQAFSESGLLSIGYTYPNQYMAERYNSPSSPLWALKAFAPLLIGRDHPFWTCAEKPFDDKNQNKAQTGPGLYIFSKKKAGHFYALNSGQWTPGPSNEHLHMAEKYSKFAYSSYFGFNVVTDGYGADKLAPDNMLLLSDNEDGDFFRYRLESRNHVCSRDFLYSEWTPFADVEIRTWLVPMDGGSWHLRAHAIKSGRKLYSAEGGFAVPYGNEYYSVLGKIDPISENMVSLVTDLGVSHIENIGHSRKGTLVSASPNSNLIHPRTLIPVLRGEHEKGEFALCCAVFANPDPAAEIKRPDIVKSMTGLPDEVRNLINGAK